ncbi:MULTISPECIES: hypothetical protein [unclassified Campylobacter]|uniref:hypothetical protein n=1 Tax=unclassified Campylobacter TaxID=2593542 RepID=UPI003D35371B
MKHISKAKNATKRIKFPLPPSLNTKIKKEARKLKMSYTAFFNMAYGEFLECAKKENLFFT